MKEKCEHNCASSNSPCEKNEIIAFSTVNTILNGYYLFVFSKGRVCYLSSHMLLVMIPIKLKQTSFIHALRISTRIFHNLCGNIRYLCFSFELTKRCIVMHRIQFFYRLVTFFFCLLTRL